MAIDVLIRAREEVNKFIFVRKYIVYCLILAVFLLLLGYVFAAGVLVVAAIIALTYHDKIRREINGSQER